MFRQIKGLCNFIFTGKMNKAVLVAPTSINRISNGSMKNIRTLSYAWIFVIFIFTISLPVVAQDSTAIKDTSLVIPFRDLPVSNVKASASKKTRLLVISMDFENLRNEPVSVSLFLGGWYNFGFATDKGHRYAVPIYYDRLTQDNPNTKFRPVEDIGFGTKKLSIASILVAEIEANGKRGLTVKVPKFDTTSRVIREFHVECQYHQYGSGTVFDQKGYRIKDIAIDWK